MYLLVSAVLFPLAASIPKAEDSQENSAVADAMLNVRVVETLADYCCHCQATRSFHAETLLSLSPMDYETIHPSLTNHCWFCLLGGGD